MESGSDDLTTGLPSPQEDEPTSLRQDLLDEVRDHLLCATRREQLCGATDEQTGWQRAISCFGNPAAIVRQLYWQAMWSRVMQQRIVLAGTAGMLALGFIMVGLMWTMLQGQRDLVQQQLLASERQQANMEALLARVATPTSTVGSLKVALDRPARARLSGGTLPRPFDSSTTAVTGQQGAYEVDFGELSPGIYTVEITSPEGWHSNERVVLRTGESRRLEVSVPQQQIADVRFTTNLPESGLAALSISVVSEDTLKYKDAHWERHRDGTVPAGKHRSKVSLRTDLIGPVQLQMYFIPGNQIEDCIVCSLSKKYDVAAKGSKPYEMRIFDFELRPGANSLQIEVPQEWILQIQKRADEVAWPLNVNLIKESVEKAVENGLKTLAVDSGDQKKRIAFLSRHGNLPMSVNTEYVTFQLIRTAIHGTPSAELVSEDLIEEFRNETGWGTDELQVPQCRQRLEMFLKDRGQSLDGLLFANITMKSGATPGVPPQYWLALDVIDQKTNEKITASAPLLR